MAIDIPFGLKARGPSGPAPRRNPRSVRRTSSIDMTWPAGQGAQLRLVGRARDLFTPDGDGSPLVLGADAMSVGVNSATRAIEDIEVDPHRRAVQQLIGTRGGSSSRAVLTEVLADEARSGTPLYLLLDDITGASLIAGFAYSQWVSIDQLIAARADSPRRSMEGVCTGFQPGSGALSLLFKV